MARRLYLGRLPTDARSEDVNKFFEGYGRIVDCRVMTGFGFVEFESSKACFLFTTYGSFLNFLRRTLKMLSKTSTENLSWEQPLLSSLPKKVALVAIHMTTEAMGHHDPADRLELGSSFLVFPATRAGRYANPPSYHGFRGPVPNNSSLRGPSLDMPTFVSIPVVRLPADFRDSTGQPSLVFWIPASLCLDRGALLADLKDFGRDAGSVSFADIDRDVPGQGILEYLNRDDADRAVKELDGKELRGRPVRVALDDSRVGPDNYRRDDRRDDRPREDRYREDRYRDDRGYRRDRSRSPPRRPPAEFDDRRPRSPPPRREVDDRRPAGYDDYRRGGYDDRRGPDYYVDRRRDDIDRRRDDRRRDEKDERYDERPPRHANGDGGWSR
ncbi:hypothetical protein D9615_004114 [Tricholomella constricta]|uniref:RRM domain-containing protein n=1 Tax=Tricholomella constricta TaxID=117010 RepID=A0A8H5HCJ6_9AGAR|nr:hypothetical protein D9615_004114 [Tricholomella constricta]